MIGQPGGHLRRERNQERVEEEVSLPKYDSMFLRTLGRFAAADPWNGNRVTEFSIEEYVMMPSGSPQAVDSGVFAHTIGLRSELDGSQRMIPESLFELWKRGQVPAERIPTLARAIAPRVLAEDLNLMLGRSNVRSMLAVLVTVFLIITGIAAFEELSFAAALAVGAAFSLFIGAIFWLVLRSGRARRREQMKWLLRVNFGNVNAEQPESRGAGRLKMALVAGGVMLAGILLWVGGFALWDSQTAKGTSPSGSAPAAAATAAGNPAIWKRPWCSVNPKLQPARWFRSLCRKRVKNCRSRFGPESTMDRGSGCAARVVRARQARLPVISC
jgi:hypothetical protein